MAAFRSALLLPLALAAGATPALAQTSFSLGYQWLEAVKDENRTALNKIASDKGKLNAAVLDYQGSVGGAVHVVVRRNDALFLRFMLGLGANPNLVNKQDGETPLTLAAILNQSGMFDILLQYGAKPDLGNKSGETPLIKAVRFHRIDMIQNLLQRGADPDKRDYSAKSARMYAAEDTRAPEIAKLLTAVPKKVVKPVSGPRLN